MKENKNTRTWLRDKQITGLIFRLDEFFIIPSYNGINAHLLSCSMK